MRLVTFRHWYAPGDLLAFTPALRDLHLTYRNEFETRVNSCYPEVFYNSPYIAMQGNKWGEINLNPFEWKQKYQDQGFHYTDAYYALLESALNVKIKKTSIFPEIYLTDEEKIPKVPKPYWVINAGMKSDIPLKQYPAKDWQLIVDGLVAHGVPLVQTGHPTHMHPALEGVDNWIGRTDNLRDYFSLIYNSSGVICHVSLPMHIAAAFRKPCVVLAGGRENPRWEFYPGQRFLHSIGYLDCCQETGCWKKSLQDCTHRHGTPDCFRFIPPEFVVDTVLYYH